MLQLRDVTLCAVASRFPDVTLRVLMQMMRVIQFGDVVLCAPPYMRNKVPSNVSLKEIPEFPSLRNYSCYMLENLSAHVKSSHVLIVQWDGFVLHPESWRPAFLEYDYIGAVWPQFVEGRNVGNGGFSLRSRRLLEACRDPEFVVSHPEDLCICHRNRELLEQRYNLRFAPTAVAEQFSYERAPPSVPSFGFHGLFNFPDFLSPEELQVFLDAVPAEMLRARDTYDLAQRLATSGSATDWACVYRLLRCQSVKSYRPLAWLQLATQYALRGRR